MAGTAKNERSHWWWLDTHSSTTRSPWLQSTLAELNEKTNAMLRLIEEDADSFAKRAEMYYKKRPELVSMVEDFYRTHRSLAERFDQVRHDNGSLLSSAGGSPFASAKYQFEKLLSFSDHGYDTYSDNCEVDQEDSAESEVDDPDQEEEKEALVVAANDEDEVMRLRDEVQKLSEENKANRDKLMQKDMVCDEVMMLREEVERLRKENEAQKEQLKQKDQEKIEVIRHLSVAIDVLKQENVKMSNFIAKEYTTKKWKKNPFDLSKFVGAFSSGRFFTGTPKNQPSVELSRCD